MTRFVGGLAGAVALAALAARADDRKGDKGGPPPDAPADVRRVLAEAGFGENGWPDRFPDYVRFGTPKAADAFRAGDQFDKLDVEKAAAGHRAALGRRAFVADQLRLQVRVPRDVEADGVLADLPLPMRVRAGRPFYREPAGAFTGLVAAVRPSELGRWDQAFLTKDGTLQACTAAEALRVRQLDGVLYNLETGPTTLTLVLNSLLKNSDRPGLWGATLHCR